MGIGGEETKHEVANGVSSRQQQPLTQQQVLQHLSTLQKRMGQMQSFAKGLTDQAQQDKIKIQTLEQQLEAAKTLQWAKQKVSSPRVTTAKKIQQGGQAGSGSGSGSSGSGLPPKPHPKVTVPPITTPRLEEIRKFRQEREEKLRFQFSHSSMDDLVTAEHNHELEDKLNALQEKFEALQDTNGNLQAENANILLEHTESLAEKQSLINKYEEEIKALEELIEESYHERETLERKLIKTTNKKASLDLQLERMEENSKELKKRDEENTLLLMQAHDTEDYLRMDLADDSLEALAGQEGQEDMIQQLESMIETLEHRLEKASRHLPQQEHDHDGGNDNVLDLYHELESLKKQLKEQEDNFHNETIDMEVELMDAQEFGRMQREMSEAQEMELLLLSNALADLEKDHPLARSLSGGDLFAIDEEEPEGVDKSLDNDDNDEENKTGAKEQQSAQQPPIPPPPPPLVDEESPQRAEELAKKEAEKLKKEQEQKEFEDLAKKAHFLTLHKNIYSLSRQFEWQLQRREELEAKVEKMKKTFDNVSAKYIKTNDELKKLQAASQGKNQAAQVGDAESAENKESLTRQLMRASMSIRNLQQELTTSKERTSQLEQELQKKAPTEGETEGEQSDSAVVAQLRSQLEEQCETNELIKEFMQDLKVSYQNDRDEWNAQQQELNQKIEQLSLELKRRGGGDEDSSALPSPPTTTESSSPSPRSAMDRLEATTTTTTTVTATTTTPAKSAQEESTLLIASPPKTPLRKEWMTEISVVRSEISRLKRTLQSKQPQNESFLGAMDESDSHQSDDYIFADRSDDDIQNDETKASGSTSASEKWYQEVTALGEELNELTLELRKSHHHENKVAAAPVPLNWKKAPPNPVQTGPGMLEDDTSSVDSSTTGGFENEILLLRKEVDRQHEQRKNAVSPYSAVSSAGSNTSPSNQVHKSGSSLVSSLEGDSSFTEFVPSFSEI